MTAPAGFATFYGLTIATCDEDAEAFVVLGHRRIAAAANHLLRTERVERYRPGVGELPTIEHTFGVITEHQADEDGEGGGWTLDFTGPDEAGTRPVSLLTVPGLGDFELLAVPSRCPDCTRLTTTAHYMRAEMERIGAPGRLGHDCRTCGTIWPATSRSVPAPAEAA